MPFRGIMGTSEKLQRPCQAYPKQLPSFRVHHNHLEGLLKYWLLVSAINWHLPLAFAIHCYEDSEKAMAPYSSTLAWKIPWMEEPGWLQSMGLLGVRHDWATSLSLFTFMHWRRKWQPTSVFLPGESQGQESLVGWCLWGHTEVDTTEMT